MFPERPANITVRQWNALFITAWVICIGAIVLFIMLVNRVTQRPDNTEIMAFLQGTCTAMVPINYEIEGISQDVIAQACAEEMKTVYNTHAVALEQCYRDSQQLKDMMAWANCLKPYNIQPSTAHLDTVLKRRKS